MQPIKGVYFDMSDMLTASSYSDIEDAKRTFIMCMFAPGV